MQIVGGHQSQIELLGQLLQGPSNLVLLGQIVVLNLQKIVVLAKNINIFLNAAPRPLHIILENQHGQLPGYAGAKANQALTMSPQSILVNAGLVIKAFYLANAHQLHQIMVASVIFCQQNQVEHAPVILFEMGARGQVNLTA